MNENKLNSERDEPVEKYMEIINSCITKQHLWSVLPYLYIKGLVGIFQFFPEEDAKNSVVKLGKENDEVFAKRILGHDLKNLIVINDEAHHAYRVDVKVAKEMTKSELERDKRWIEGLDKIHRARNILKCFDFTATPFPPGKNVSNCGSFEVTKKEDTDSELVRNLLSINGVTGVFLGADFLSINKKEDIIWDDIKHIVISLINDFYATGKKFVIANELFEEKKEEYNEIEKKIISILETKIRPAVAKDGGDIKFKEFKDGIVKVELQGSCSGCPSSTMTLKQGVQNLLCHYLPEVKEVVAI